MPRTAPAHGRACDHWLASAHSDGASRNTRRVAYLETSYYNANVVRRARSIQSTPGWHPVYMLSSVPGVGLSLLILFMFWSTLTDATHVRHGPYFVWIVCESSIHFCCFPQEQRAILHGHLRRSRSWS
jgi:hypothetical protein